MTDRSELVLYERRGKVAYITFNRPEKLNAFTDDSVIAFKQRLREYDTDPDAWVAILHGNGRAFSSGADVNQRQLRSRDELIALGGPSGQGASHQSIFYEGFVNWKPIIGAVHGYAFGMAFGMALRCDLIVSDADAQFQVTEISRGLYSGQYWSIMQFRGAGTFADEIFMTGRRFTGQEAFDRGLINRIAENQGHVAVAEELAEAILANPPLAIRAMVRSRRWHLQQHEREHPLFYDGFKLHLTNDFRESAKAFAEKRKPGPFTGT